MSGYDQNQALEWARKVAASRPPRYTDASRNAARCIIAYCDHDAPDQARELLEEARRQLEYLDGRFPTGTTPAVIARIDAYLKGAA